MTGPVIVTGASSGIGLETAVYLARRGFRVLAGIRNPGRSEKLETAAARQGVSLDLLQLDVTDPASIRAAVEKVVDRYGAIEALVSNAGIQIRGYFEDLSEQEIRRVFDTNVFGAMATTAEVLPHMRRARRGRILLVTSVGGRIGSPALSAYCASKFALEGFGECLALEVAPLGIQVSLIEPGIVKTEIWGPNRGVAPGALNPESPYYYWFREQEDLADWAVRTSPTRPADVARAVHRALTVKNPRLRYLVGRRARALLAIRRLLPSALFERLYSRIILQRVTRSTGLQR